MLFALVLALVMLAAGFGVLALVLHRRGIWRLPRLRRARMQEAW